MPHFLAGYTVEITRNSNRNMHAALIAQLVEALADLLREAEDGHAVCAYTRWKAREALRVAKEGTA